VLFDLNRKEGYLHIRKYDVCVCGSGPAGITVARALAAKGKKVAVVEGGSLEYTDRSQSIYEGQSVGEEYWDGVQNLRLRYFGGTSNHWSGRCSLFNDADFELRPFHGLSGWPFKRSELHKYLSRAKEILDLPSEAFINKAKRIGKNFEDAVKALSPPTLFGEKYIAEIENSKNIDVYINANLINVRLSGNLMHVAGFDLINYNGNRFTLQANDFILAMGAIENARILLNSDSQVNTGVGNHGDMVGRCFMEHFNVQYGRFVIDNKKFWSEEAFQIAPSVETVRSKNIGNGIISFQPNAEVSEYGRLGELRGAVRKFVCQSETVTDLSRKVVDFDCSGDGVIGSLIEQIPNLNSRITLASEKDAIGLRSIILDWQVADEDLRTIRTLGIESAKEMARIGAARVQLHDSILDPNVEIKSFGRHAHQMGTTRMSSNSRYGVVDESLRVHGVSNLYIAGSSVFPTGGGVNPTITIVMLSLRLADYISAKT